MDDLIALFGFFALLVGIYLWLGLAATLITLGLVLMYVGWKMPPKEPKKVNNGTN